MIISSEGDLGDCVYLFCLISQIEGGPHTLLLQGSGITKFKGIEGAHKLHSLIAPLAVTQPYIAECRVTDGTEHIDWKSGEFRSNGYVRGRSLVNAHLEHLIATKGIGHGFTAEAPWIHWIIPSPSTEGKVVINRTGRYRNSTFPWAAVVRHYSHRLVFVGMQHEWREFCSYFGYVDYFPTSNMLELAQAIAGAALFIGNQSCAYALAESMKKNSIQETDLGYPDCVFARPNAQYVHDGACTLPAVGTQKNDLKVEKAATVAMNFSTQMAPPGRWQFPGAPWPCEQFEQMVTEVAKMEGMKDMDREDVRMAVLMHNVDRCPGWQQPPLNAVIMQAFDQAGLTASGVPK